jgi:methyl-accepting chemotaxis protein
VNISLKRSLQYGFGLVIALTAVSCLITIIELGSIRSTERGITEIRFPSVLASERIGQGNLEASFAYRNYMIYGENPELAQKYEKARQDGWNKVFIQIEMLKHLGQEKDLALQIEKDVRDGNIRIQEETRFDIVGKGPAMRQAALDHMKAGSSLVAKTNADCAELSKRVRASLEDDQKQLASTEQFATRMTILCAVLCAIVGISLGHYVIKRLSTGIGRIVERTRSIAAGNLKAPTEHGHSEDEIGTALASIDEMQRSLAKTITGVVNSAHYLATASEELSSSAASIARSTAEQSSQAEQVATAMHEMSATVVEISENSRAASSKAESAGASAREGGRIVGSMTTVITDLADSTTETARKIEQLGNSSNQIGKIVCVIDDIADQTNLLALNAAIEAARAGEQGRGFAVVADEVRKLAERTTSATREIGDMIKMIQDETHNAVQAMHSGSGKVEEGVQSSRRAGESLAKIIESADSVQEMVTQIATAATEQAATTEEVNNNLQIIASMVQKSAIGASSSAKSSEDLSNLALQLHGLVREFQIDEATKVEAGQVSQRMLSPGITGYRDSTFEDHSPRLQ